MKIQSLGQLFFIGVAGTTLSEQEKEFIVEHDIGGVILFGRNLDQSPDQALRLNSEIKSLQQMTASKSPIFISVDQEGGRVQRLKGNPFVHWPSLQKVGAKKSPALSQKFSRALATELASVGFNLDFAPCLDIFNNSSNTVIGDRSIGQTALGVGQHVAALIDGLHQGGVLSCGKHFPGHGHTLIDSHEDLPREKLTLERLFAEELIPFKTAIDHQIPMLMTAHILFENIDPNNPATLSKKFLSDILRRQLGFKGFIVSDDLDMKALTKHLSREEIPVRFLQAGGDLLLYCNEPSSPGLAMKSIRRAVDSEELNLVEIESKIARVLKFKRTQFKEILMRKEFAKSEIGSEDHFQLKNEILAEN